MERIIETEHVNRVFAVSSGEFCALKDINVSIPEGAFAILKGRSGSGKTTLMNIIGALDYPTSGKVRIAGNDITEMSELRMAGISENRKERVEECLRRVGLAGRMRHMPAEMSGGEQQRVAIARAIAHHPRILFADEPTAELDSVMAAEIVQMFQEITKKERVTILMTTHDTGLMDAGDMLIELQNGEQICQKQ